MRIGNNPLKNKTITPLSKVVALVITHLPNLEGYHQQRWKVIYKSLTSLYTKAGMEHDLIIWDNGSCKEFRDWLITLDYTDQLILSRNIGKTNALKSVMQMLPENTILAYGDDDIEYFSNWLAPQIEILRTFPNVGAVTGWPVRGASMWGMSAVKDWHFSLGSESSAEIGRFIPDEWEKDYCDSIGLDYNNYSAVTWATEDMKITYNGVSALATCQHCQFICYPERIVSLIDWTDKAMADEIDFDKHMDMQGFLRLSTVERYTRHIGNILD